MKNLTCCKLVIACAFLVAASDVQAWLPPPQLPTARPERMEAARSMISHWPLDSDGTRFAIMETRRLADEWFNVHFRTERDRNVGWFFVLMVQREADTHFDEALKDVQSDLAMRFALGMDLPHLQEAETFFASEAGQAYLQSEISNNRDLRSDIAHRLFRRLLPQFETIVENAREKAGDLLRINERARKAGTQ